jgi:hypothetical protein
MSGDGYSLNGSIGQTAAGPTGGSGRLVNQGFWQQFLSIVYNRLPLIVKH